jgi:hypothetical protein
VLFRGDRATQAGRVRYEPADRAWFAALAPMVSRRRRAAVLAAADPGTARRDRRLAEAGRSGGRSAVQGQGAFLNGEPIHVSDNGDLAEAMVTVGDYAVGPDADRKNKLRLAVTAQLARQVLRVRMRAGRKSSGPQHRDSHAARRRSCWGAIAGEEIKGGCGGLS